MGIASRLRDVGGFLMRGQWALDLADQPPRRAARLRWLRVLTLAFRKFFLDHCPMRAAMLTLVLLFSLAPTMAVGFAVAKGFGIQEKVRDSLYKQVGVDDTQDNPAGEQIKDMLDSMLNYVDKINAAALGLVGFALVLYAAYRVLASIEATLNEIWTIRQKRKIIQRTVDYLAVFFVLPLMFMLAALMSAGLETPKIIEFTKEHQIWGLTAVVGRLATFTFTGVGLTFLYFFFPNTRVRPASALVGGLVAALLWLPVQYAFLKLQIGVGKYNLIYASFAAVPIFLLWVQFTWWVILFGAEVSYAHARQSDYEYGGPGFQPTAALREEIGLGAAALAGRAFLNAAEPPSIVEIAKGLRAPLPAVRDVLDDLIRARVLVEVQADPPCFQPAEPLEHITLGRIVQAVHHRGVGHAHTTATLENLGLAGALRARDTSQAAFYNTTLLAVAKESRKAGTV